MLTTVVLPNSMQIDLLRSELRKKDIIIYNGKGPFLNAVFQVGNIGNLNERNILYFLKSLKCVKDSLIKKETFKKSYRSFIAPSQL